MSTITIAITGHRSLSVAEKQKVKPVIEKALRNIMLTMHEQQPATRFIALSPLAEGADALFAHVALSLGIPLQILLPFERDEYLKRFSGEAEQLEFISLYDKVEAGSRHVIPMPADMPDSDRYAALGHKLVDDADFVIAVWNEKPGHGKGGTADVVAYAREKKKDILLIDPEDEHPHINYLHSDYKHRRHTDVIDVSATNHLLGFIRQRMKEFDDNAGYYDKKYKRVWTAGFVIGLVEVLAFAIAVAFHASLTLHFILAATEFISIVVIILLVLFGGTKKLHSRYVHNRLLAERLRIKQYFAELGLRIFHTSVSPIYFSLKEKPEFHILDNTIRLINLSALSYLPFETRKKKLDDELLTDQHKYHERKKEKFERKNSLYKKVRESLFLVLVAAITLHFMHVANEFFVHHGITITSWSPGIFHSDLFEELVLFCSIFIPATIAAAEALKYLYEWEKIITLSSSMAAYFKEQSKKLKSVHTESELEHFLNGINKDMLIENLDWEKYMHDKNEVPA